MVSIVTSVLQKVTGHCLILRLRTSPHVYQARCVCVCVCVCAVCRPAHLQVGQDSRNAVLCARCVWQRRRKFGLWNYRRLSKLEEFPDWLRSYGNGKEGADRWGQSVSQSVGRSVGQSVGRSANQSVSKPARQSVNESVS